MGNPEMIIWSIEENSQEYHIHHSPKYEYKTKHLKIYFTKTEKEIRTPNYIIKENLFRLIVVGESMIITVYQVSRKRSYLAFLTR